MLRLDNATTRTAITYVTVASSLFIGSQSAAHAGGAMKEFREFRQNNPGLDRGALRQMFKQHNTNPGGQGNPAPSPITILPVFPDRGPIDTPRNNQIMSFKLESVRVASEEKTKNKSFQFGEGGIKISGADGIEIDLTSDRKNISVGGKLFGDSTVKVNAGGQEVTVGAGSEVTAAEYIAAKQVLLTGSQSLELQEVNAGRGEANLNVETLTGTINEKGNVIHSVANTQVSASFSSYSAGNLFWGPGLNSESLNDTFANVGSAVLNSSLLTATSQGSPLLRAAAQSDNRFSNAYNETQSVGTSNSSGNVELGGNLNSVDLKSSLNTLQSTINLLTAQNSISSASEALEDMIDMDEEESYSIGYDGTEYGGSICTELDRYNAITAGSANSLPHVLLSERVNGLHGRSLLLPNQDTSIGTEFGDVKIKAGSIVLFSACDNGIAIYNIHDSGKNSVSLEVGGKQIALAPGRHISITRDKTTDFATINHVESISHRGLRSVSLNDELIAYISDFSPLSAMSNVHSVKTIMKGQNSESKKLASKLIKTSAVLMHIAGPSNFKFFPKPSMTASLLTEQL